MDRREFLVATASASAFAFLSSAHAEVRRRTWIATTESAPFQDLSPNLREVSGTNADVTIDVTKAFQTIDGFGACFNELGAQALNRLDPAARSAILDDLFRADGMNLSLCRMPIGASDYALDWYSHDEHDGDFAMAKFSIDRDRKLLLPYIAAARKRRPDLRVWASPWSPPTWMKTNRHYAAAMTGPNQPPNGLRPEQVGREGTDMFIQDERYFKAYALYFRRFVDAYADAGQPVFRVMPQNEFNSAQVFPSCCWTPEGLARFIPHLGKALEGSGTDIFFGTLERPDPALFEKVYGDPAASAYIKGVGVQWAGKGAVPFIHHEYPNLPIWQSEQECGDGKNDWRYARYVWTLMKHYLGNGASAYMYWNMALMRGGVSTWGWQQNSLLTIDPETGIATKTFDYYLLGHLSRFVQPGARRVAATSWTGYENQLAFQNPDGRVVVLVQNDMSSALPIRYRVGAKVFDVELPKDSFNTLVLA